MKFKSERMAVVLQDNAALADKGKALLQEGMGGAIFTAKQVEGIKMGRVPPPPGYPGKGYACRRARLIPLVC